MEDRTTLTDPRLAFTAHPDQKVEARAREIYEARCPKPHLAWGNELENGAQFGCFGYKFAAACREFAQKELA